MNHIVDNIIVLYRTNYGERDRIITILGKESGKKTIFAKGVRAQKSKLAAGIELLCLSNITYIEGKTDLMTLTSARIVTPLRQLLGDQARLAFAFECLKTINKLVDSGSGQEYYPILEESLRSLNDSSQDERLVKIWFDLQLLGKSGCAPDWRAEEGASFNFDYERQAFVVIQEGQGAFSQNDLKLLRLSSTQLKPLKLKTEAGSEDRIATFSHNLLKTNLTEV